MPTSNRETNGHREIYQRQYGPIPIDENGRSYEIHHIDGNHKNNDISNLKAVTIKEHYDIHYAQGDYGACLLIAKRMQFTAAELRELNRQQNFERMADGTHPFVGANNPVYAMVANGTHNFIGGKIQREAQRKRVEAGTHHLLGGEIQRRVVAEGRHHLSGGNLHRRLVQEGRHPNQVKLTCPHCGKIGSKPGMKRWHFDNCKSIS